MALRASGPGGLSIPELAEHPATPPSGTSLVYSINGVVYTKNDDGVEVAIVPAVAAPAGALVDGGGPSTNHTGNLRLDFGSVT